MDHRSCIESEPRIGNESDVLRLMSGRALIIGGVTTNHSDGLGLDGRNDADP